MSVLGNSYSGVSLVEEIGGYRILSRPVPLRFCWFSLSNTLTIKAGTVFRIPDF